jgi:hypothetical protein
MTDVAFAAACAAVREHALTLHGLTLRGPLERVMLFVCHTTCVFEDAYAAARGYENTLETASMLALCALQCVKPSEQLVSIAYDFVFTASRFEKGVTPAYRAALMPRQMQDVILRKLGRDVVRLDEATREAESESATLRARSNDTPQSGTDEAARVSERVMCIAIATLLLRETRFLLRERPLTMLHRRFPMDAVHVIAEFAFPYFAIMRAAVHATDDGDSATSSDGEDAGRASDDDDAAAVPGSAHETPLHRNARKRGAGNDDEAPRAKHTALLAK